MTTTKIQKTSLVLLIFFFGGLQVTQAQFWKKIAKKAEKKIEREAEKRVERRVSKKIDKVFDGAENTIDGIDIKTSEKDINLPESYSFEWKYVLQMESETHKKKQKEMGDMKITYLLSTQSTAFATQFDMGNEKTPLSNSLMVMDLNAGVSFTLMEVNGEKIIQKMPSMANILNENNEPNDNSNNAKIKKIGTKEILGYTCQGFEIQLEEGISSVYINPNAPVSFNHNGDSKFAPKGFKTEWLKEFKNGLMMEMTFISSKKQKHNIKMTCVELVKEPFTVHLNEYKSFMEMGEN